MEALLLLVTIISAIFVYYKKKLQILDEKFIIYNNQSSKEFLYKELEKITYSSNRILFKVNGKEEFLPHSIMDSSDQIKLFSDSIMEKRPDLFADELKQKMGFIYKNSLCFDSFTFIVEKTGFFATLLAVLSFFVAMFIVVDYSSIKEFGEISYLIYSLAWPFLAGFLLFLGFIHYVKKTDVDKFVPNVISEYFHNYPFSLVFSTFAEIFILLSVLKYFC